MSSEIINVTSFIPGAIRNPDISRGAFQTTDLPASASEDVVEFSEVSRSLAAEVSSSSFRRARIEALRQQIAEGNYETAERIRGTVDRLLDVIV